MVAAEGWERLVGATGEVEGMAVVARAMTVAAAAERAG